MKGGGGEDRSIGLQREERDPSFAMVLVEIFGCRCKVGVYN